MKHILTLIKISLLLLVTMASCRSGAGNLFKTSSPHEQYQRKLIAAGLDKTSMGKAWSTIANQSLNKALLITPPYKANGYFAAEKIPAMAYRFEGLRGQKISIHLVRSAASVNHIYVDLLTKQDNGEFKVIASADTTGKPLIAEMQENITYFIRLQPELLSSAAYTIEITAGPSLNFPLTNNSRKNIQSLFGDGRDAGSRKHEGIDIFSPFHTPVLAAADGTVTRVNENNLGGKVVWMRPEGKNYTLYYAHLDRQIAVEGQQVKSGDTLGLMGNTGNAKTTSPHLHFGIYTPGGTVDPLPFVNPVIQPLPEVTAAANLLNTRARTKGKTNLYLSASLTDQSAVALPPATVIFINAAYKNAYGVELPDGKTGFIKSRQLTALAPLRKIKITSSPLPGYEQPGEPMIVKTNFSQGETISVMGVFSNYLLVSGDTKETAWIVNNGSW
ncbi:M23 family metallopeptidase [Pedobacter sp. MR2016-24]|uniref:M23 family metallopeptidase n=1 Tax=Pedobacter sp. MR2016-24 TaxID=2994466 RepID=UPI002244FCF7|nr:M23 family metallopeptidase [Pedobacter sp. MR2016-24]MCX2485324.1 M23 family metallopeptidase [Pedobacter sp. MR2016-24]